MKNIDPMVLVLEGYGINCGRETKHAFELAGLPEDNVQRVHINDLIEGNKRFGDYQILAFPGGFSFGDDTGSGKALASKIRNRLMEPLLYFIEKYSSLIIGVCNGFQDFTNLGLLPALSSNYGVATAALKHNDSARFKNRWVDLLAEGDSPWVKGVGALELPIRHGEGNFYAPPEVLAQIEENGQVALRYAHGRICEHFGYDANPNGSLHNIAGITDPSGRVFGLMPHPEAATHMTNHAMFTFMRELSKRTGVKLPEEGPGLQIIRNGVEYCRRY